jgi:hypothetical protein
MKSKNTNQQNHPNDKPDNLIQLMWNVKTNVTPVLTGATGTISRPFRKYLSYITGKHEIKEMQKTAILSTAHILRKVLM